MIKVLVEAVEADGDAFVNFFKSKLIALISDGASSMIAPGTSLFTKLKELTGRSIISVHCMAHRLDLSIEWAVEKGTMPYFNRFDNLLNSIYTFYQSRGSKRFQHLQNMADDLGIRLRRLKYWFGVRWSASHYGAVRAVENDYSAIYRDLDEMSKDTSFTVSTRKKAAELFESIQDQSFVITLKLYKDILFMYKKLSESLQSRSGLLMGSNQLIINVKETFGSLKTNKPPALTSFLSLIVICTCVVWSHQNNKGEKQNAAPQQLEHFIVLDLEYPKAPNSTRMF